MESASILQKGVDWVKKATEEEQDHNYEAALRLYEHGVECFFASIEHEISGEEAKESVRGMCVQYSDRAAQLKEYLEDLKTEFEPFPILSLAIYFVTKATEEDQNGNYEEALQLYERALELFMFSIQSEPLSEKNEKYIRAKCVDYSDRAALIKKFLEKGKKTSVFSKLNCCC